jgi:hypothetical protein
VGSTHHGVPGGGGAPWWVVLHQAPPSGGSWLQYFLFIPQKILEKFRGILRTFIFAQKQHHGSSAENSVSPGLVSFKSCKLESKTRAKELGKVDTLETYQLPPSLNLCLSSSNSVDKLKVRKKTFTISFVLVFHTYA